jgi:hypothetical protein
MKSVLGRRKIRFDLHENTVYAHLEPILDLLLDNGNRLSTEYRWGEDRTGYFCHFRLPLNFDLIESTFELPAFIRLYPDEDKIGCNVSWVTIRGIMK